MDEKREDNGGAPLLGSAREVGESVEVEVVAGTRSTPICLLFYLIVL